MLVLRDLDVRDGVACAPELVARLLPPERTKSLALRIAVRASESWMMADREAAMTFFATLAIPGNPDGELYPKRPLVNACRKSTNRRVKQGMVPDPGSSAAVGIGYVGLTREFVEHHWSVERARLASPSLASALRRIEHLIESKIW